MEFLYFFFGLVMGAVILCAFLAINDRLINKDIEKDREELNEEREKFEQEKRLFAVERNLFEIEKKEMEENGRVQNETESGY